MARRMIIRIDEELCNGCGECITDCAEGALALVNGKAKLVKESFCDGLGACIGACPTGALTLEERECPEFDHTLGGALPAQGHHTTQPKPTHTAQPLAPPPLSGCPGTQARTLHRGPATQSSGPAPVSVDGPVIRPEINQWPLQLHLLSPIAPFLHNRDLVLVSTCSPLASPDINWRFLRGKSVAIACPKLDRTDGYLEKLTEILSNPTIPGVIVLRMEVPCCSGLTALAMQAARSTGRKDLFVREVTIGIQGEIQSSVDRSVELSRTGV